MEKDSTGALQRAFVEAAKSGNVDALQHLWNDPQFQEHRGNLSRTDPISNWNALMWTCEANHLDAVVFLLDIGFEVDVASFDGQTALLRTAANGCLPLVTLLLSRGANINITTDSGDTPLTTAARHGHHDVVQALLEAGAKVDHETTSGNYTALALASKFGHGTVVDLLLQHRASVDLPSFNAFTPLMFASQNGHTACVKSLIDAGANINLQEGANRTALMLATEHGCRQVVSLLLQAGAEVEHACKCLGRFPINPTALVRAAEHGYDTIVGLLLEAGAQLRAHAFAIALEKGHQNVLAELMLVGEDGFDHDDQDDRDEAKLDREDLEVRYPSFERKDDDEGYNTLRLAAGRGDAATVEQLLSADSNTLQLRLGQEHPLLDGIRSKDLRTFQLLTAASVSKPAANLQRKQSLLDFGGVFGMTPIILSARLGRLDMVKVLLEAGADPNGIDSWKRRTALIEATRQGRYDIAILLLRYGADTNAGGQSRTALAHAVGKNDVAMMKLLIAAGAESTPANMKQKRAQPLIVAVKNGSSEALQLLLEAGADPNAHDERNNLSPIIIAAKKNDAKVIAMLADAGANVNGTMWNGWSALAFAARDGCLEATNELINRSAYVDAAVSKKYTPVLLAAKNGHTEVARLLLSAGADTDALASDGRSAFDIASLRGFEDICTLLREYGFLSTMGDPVQQQEKTSEVGFGEGHSGTTPLSLYPQDSADKPERSWSDQHTLTEMDLYTATSGISLATFGSFLSPADESQRQTERDGQTDLETINSKSGGQSIGSMDPNHTRQALDPSPAVNYDLCDDCMSMIPPIAELKARSSQKDDGNHHKQMLSYDSLSTSAKSGCPGCKMARSFLHRHWSVTELENKPISRSVMVNEKDKKKGFSDFRKLETLHEGGGKGKEFVRDNSRMLHFTTRGIGLDGLSPEQLQDKLLQHDVVGDVWDFQTLLVEYQIGKVKGPICRFVVYADGNDIASKYTSSRPWKGDLQSEASFETAVGWLRECEEHHEHCKTHSVSSPLPTRLIDVGSPTRSPRLCITQNQMGQYAALTYCWGGPQSYCTTEATLQDHLNGFAPDELPQTITDAIETTRKLGLNYIWIDAFCIIQDSTQDKSTELANMHNVYKNAHVTISAASAGSCHDGFLGRASPPLSSTVDSPRFCRFPVRCDERRVGTFTLEGPIWDWSFFSNHPDPIMQRAWTMQEHWLSPRLLMYGSKGLSWLCDSTQQRYGGPTVDHFTDNLPRLDQAWYALNEKHANDASREDQKSADEKVKSWHLWESLVVDYTQRSLSVAEDKLPGLSGLAQEFGSVTCDEYLAGLWRKALLDNLCWYSKQPGTARPKASRAPSWSWASIDGAVGFVPPRMGFQAGSTFSCAYYGLYSLESYEAYYAARFRAKPHCREVKIEECRVALKDERHPHGQVVGGSLTISGRVRPVSLVLSGGKALMEDQFTGDTLARVFLDTAEFHDGVNPDVQIWAMPLRGGSGPMPLDGLLITPLSQANTWRRVGVFTIGRIEKPDRYKYTWIGVGRKVTII